MPGKSRISEFWDVPATFATTSQKTLKRTLCSEVPSLAKLHVLDRSIPFSHDTHRAVQSAAHNEQPVEKIDSAKSQNQLGVASQKKHRKLRSDAAKRKIRIRKNADAGSLRQTNQQTRLGNPAPKAAPEGSASADTIHTASSD